MSACGELALVCSGSLLLRRSWSRGQFEARHGFKDQAK
jgi:hypothetical protein